MKKIGQTITEDGITNFNNSKKRQTVRAIILDEDKKIKLLYSKHFDDYTFPGGGVKDYEDKFKALKRELIEEVGALRANIIKEIGYVTEFKYSISGSDNIYEQTSFYYLCEVLEYGNTNFVGREIEQGIESVWISIDDAIKHNENIIKNVVREKGLKTVLIRENIVLKHIKENLL